MPASQAGAIFAFFHPDIDCVSTEPRSADWSALSYRSAKKRRLNLTVDRMQTRIIERAELLIALPLKVLHNNLLDRMYMNPIVNLVIPLWILTAYVIVSKKQATKTAH